MAGDFTAHRGTLASIAQQSKPLQNRVGCRARRRISAICRAAESEMRGEQHHVAPSIDVVPYRSQRIADACAFETADGRVEDAATAPSNRGEYRRHRAAHANRVVAAVETRSDHDATP